MKDLINVLNNIKKHLSCLDRPVCNLFQDGIETKSIHDLLTFPYKLPKEVTELYKWHNGTKVRDGDILDDLHFFPGFYFLSIQDSLNFYHSLLVNSFWQKNWFPLFTNGAGDFYPIVCTDCDIDHSEIIGFINGEPENLVEYDSLMSMILTIDECYKKGIFFIDDGCLVMDYDRHEQIARNYNPNSEAWT